jgi:hypothetical protein
MTIGRRQLLKKTTAVVQAHVEIDGRGLFLRFRGDLPDEWQRAKSLPRTIADNSLQQIDGATKLRCRIFAAKDSDRFA